MAAKLTVETQFDELFKKLQTLQTHADGLKDSFKKMGDQTSDNLKDSTAKTENYFQKMSSMGKRVAQELKNDFQALLGLNALTGALKLSSQMQGAVKEVFDLNDSIRKFGNSLGVADQNFTKFQSKLIKGLGDIGLSSESAGRVLQGLMGTGVKGENNILEYSKTSGMLASTSKTQGSEGEIARGMAEVLRAKGINPNDMGAMQGLGEELNKAYKVTGKSPGDMLKGMESMFTGMADDFRKTFSIQSMTKLAAVSQAAGPEATTFIEQYMKMSPIQRKALDAQGMAGVISDKGDINFEKFKQFSKDIKGRVGNDSQMAAESLGISAEAAQGFLRLSDNIDRAQEAAESFSKVQGNLSDSYKNSMGFAEAFNANLNKVKALVSTPLSYISQKGSDLLTAASHSTAGSAAVVGASALTAAVLAGYGTKMIGGLLGKGGGVLGEAAGLAKGVGIGSALKEMGVTPVYVVNAADMGKDQSMLPSAVRDMIGPAGTVAAGAAKGGGMLGKLGGLGAAVSLMPIAMDAMHGMQSPKDAIDFVRKDVNGDLADKMQGFMDAMDSWQSNLFGSGPQKVQVDITSRDPGINAKTKQPQGAEQ